MCLDVFRPHFSQDSATYIIINSFPRSGLIRSDTFLPLFNGSRQFMHFHCSRIENASQQCPFPSHCLRVKPYHEFPPSCQACASCSVVLHDVQRLSFQKLCHCNVHLRIDFHGIKTCLDVVDCQYWCFLLGCPFKSVSRRCGHRCGHVLKLERPVLPRCCLGVKVRQLRKCSRLNERSALFWMPRVQAPLSILPPA